MRHALFGLIAAVLLEPALAYGASKYDYENCKGNKDNLVVLSCTAIINDPRESDHNKAQAYINRGNVFDNAGDLDSALDDYGASIRLSPNQGEGYYNRAMIWEKKQQFDRAIADYTDAIRFDPSADTYVKRGLVWGKKDNVGHAVGDFTEAIKLDPKSSNAFNARCWLRAVANRDLSEALADCERALQLAPGDADVLDNRGLVYLRLSRFDDAISSYDAALKINGKLIESLYCRGIAKLRKGDTAGGNADVAAAKAINPGIVEHFAIIGIAPDKR